MPTIGTLCTGGGLVEVGAMAAGLTPIWGIEWDDAIANVGRTNGLHVVTADVCKVDPTDYERPFALHASPPCPNFSNANQGGEESEEDIAIAEAVARFVDVLRPPVFTLENVYKYRKSQSWREIAGTLDRCGYWYDLAHVNAADFSVPQTRKRMIVRAMLGQMVPHLPQPEPWIGWYSAIEDLIPTLPESKFAPWQLDGLSGLFETTLVDSAGYPDNGGLRVPVIRKAHEPANTIVANYGQRPMRAFLVSGGNSTSFTIREAHEPAFTVGDVNRVGNVPRAWLSQGRVVTMTPRALARFQTIPDWYELPESKTLACKIIGNAVPPLLYEKLIRQLITAHSWHY